MNEEKIEEKKETATGEKEPVQKQAPEAVKETPAKEGEKKEPAAKQKAEKPKNCSQCNKPIKRKTWYYRNGKYFCGKGCWKLSQKKAA